MPKKRMLGVSVLEASRQRIAWVFDSFPRICLSFSGGKDSTVMLHIAMNEAQKRNQKIGVLFVDLEGQYKLTIDHIQSCYDMYANWIEPYWVCLPIALRNAVSVYEPKWTAWESGREADWIRQPPDMAITDTHYFDFADRWYHNRFGTKMPEFEEFVPAFTEWYSQGEACASLVGIRTGESLNRWRTIAGHGTKLDGKNWTNHVQKTVWNVYPIYDWHTNDIWTYHAKFKDKPYNRLYDRMHQAGLTLHQMRICQPYGDDQRKGLWLFHIIEPETWSRIVARVNGANQGALYANESGNILGRIKIDKPEGHTWESFANLLLDSMPSKMAEHYKNKIATFIQWYSDLSPYHYITDQMIAEDDEVAAFCEQWVPVYGGKLPDEAPDILERDRKAPSWRRVCKTLLRNDYWCKGLGFSQQIGTSHQQYKQLMQKRRNQWNIFPTQ